MRKLVVILLLIFVVGVAAVHVTRGPVYEGPCTIQPNQLMDSMFATGSGFPVTCGNTTVNADRMKALNALLPSFKRLEVQCKVSRDGTADCDFNHYRIVR